jgi:hypothetical protein
MSVKGLAKTLLAVSTALLLALSAGACSSSDSGKRTTTTTSQVAEATGDGHPNSDQEKPDVDKDQDLANPDEDDHGSPEPTDRDNDSDSSGKSYYDDDDQTILRYGHAANASDVSAITTLVKRYFALATAENGAKACTLLYSTYAEAVPEDFGTSPPGPAYARGTSCPEVMTKLFRHFHDEVLARRPLLKVARVRLIEHHGVVVLSFGALPAREVHVRREGHTWKMAALIDSLLP